MDDARGWSELLGWRGERLGPVEVLQEIDSTNLEALRRIDADVAPQGLVLVARTQRRGHGSRGRAWHDVPGKSLALTTVLEWPRGVALAVATWLGAAAVGDLLDELDLASRIKWPNDLLVRERKVAGVLAETRSGGAGRPDRIALGIGVNAGHEAGDLPDDLATPATSLALEGRPLAPPDCAWRLLRRLDQRWSRLLAGDLEPLCASVVDRLGLRERRVRAELGGSQGRPPRTVEGTLLGLAPDGSLRIDSERLPGGHVAALHAL